MNVQVLVRAKPLDDPYVVKLPGISEKIFDSISTEDTPYELLDGVLIMHSPASIEHEDLFLFLAVLLRGFVARRRLGIVLGSRAVLHLRPGRKVEPDLLFLTTRRRPPRGRKEIEGTADLVVEICSESTRAYDLGEKCQAYKDAGTPEMWFIDRQHRWLVQEVRVGRSYRRRLVRRGRLASRIVPGFWVDLEWLWSEELPDPLECLQQILPPA